MHHGNQQTLEIRVPSPSFPFPCVFFFVFFFLRKWLCKNLLALHCNQAISKSQGSTGASRVENCELPLKVCRYDQAPAISRLKVSSFRTLNSWKRKAKWCSIHSCFQQLHLGAGLLEGRLLSGVVLREGHAVVSCVDVSKSVYDIYL